jgi:hypothetical protein
VTTLRYAVDGPSATLQPWQEFKGNPEAGHIACSAGIAALRSSPGRPSRAKAARYAGYAGAGGRPFRADGHYVCSSQRYSPRTTHVSESREWRRVLSADLFGLPSRSPGLYEGRGPGRQPPANVLSSENRRQLHHQRFLKLLASRCGPGRRPRGARPGSRIEPESGNQAIRTGVRSGPGPRHTGMANLKEDAPIVTPMAHNNGVHPAWVPDGRAGLSRSAVQAGGEAIEAG